MMQAGFAMLCAGSLREKNIKNIMLKVKVAMRGSESNSNDPSLPPNSHTRENRDRAHAHAHAHAHAQPRRG